jgi:hypothetical protein
LMTPTIGRGWRFCFLGDSVRLACLCLRGPLRSHAPSPRRSQGATRRSWYSASFRRHPAASCPPPRGRRRGRPRAVAACGPLRARAHVLLPARLSARVARGSLQERDPARPMPCPVSGAVRKNANSHRDPSPSAMRVSLGLIRCHCEGIRSCDGVRNIANTSGIAHHRAGCPSAARTPAAFTAADAGTRLARMQVRNCSGTRHVESRR